MDEELEKIKEDHPKIEGRERFGDCCQRLNQTSAASRSVLIELLT